MICPNCETNTLNPAYLEDLFPCHSCVSCEGNWIRLSDYLRWKEKNELFAEGNHASANIEDNEKALICPETGRLMTKYYITKDSSHRIDLSRHAHAVWLDKGEWQLLKQKNLAGNLNDIFTDPWQQKLREAQSKDALNQMYLEKFGEARYTELKRIRNWLELQENKTDCLAFLLQDDPYKL